MHISLLVATLAVAVVVRLTYLRTSYDYRFQQSWFQRWQRALIAFLMPPLLLMMVAIAILGMGSQGAMFGRSVCYLGSLVSAGIVGYATLSLIYLIGQERRTQRYIASLPQTTVADSCVAHRVDVDTAFAGYIGVWNPKLILSQPLLNTLSAEQLEAVLAHEKAHLNYRDNFVFFYLGWLRRLTSWLPGTATVWDELLLLREIRADRYAAQSVDSLTVAEALLTVVQSTLRSPTPRHASSTAQSCLSAAFAGAADSPTRLTERIEMLLSHSSQPTEAASKSTLSGWMLLGAGLPLLSMLFHTTL
jgi:Zn-dependent protease with chaperone function